MTTGSEMSALPEELKALVNEPVNGIEIWPDFAELHQKLMWEGIWPTLVLDNDLRILTTISTQCVNGQDFALQDHIRIALSVGMSPRKIKVIFVQLLF